MSKFGGIDYILLVQDFGTSAGDKNIITSSALKYATFKNVPLSRRFSTRKRETEERGRFDIRLFPYKNQFTFLSSTSLAPMTIQDKLFIFAHANSTDVGFTQARMLAGMLSANGLDAAGLITFKACEVGVGNFLEDFASAAVGKGITLGWVKGYTGSARTVTTTQGKTIVGMREKIEDDDDNEILGAGRVKIVKSPNCPLAAVGRYA